MKILSSSSISCSNDKSWYLTAASLKRLLKSARRAYGFVELSILQLVSVSNTTAIGAYLTQLERKSSRLVLCGVYEEGCSVEIRLSLTRFSALFRRRSQAFPSFTSKDAGLVTYLEKQPNNFHVHIQLLVIGDDSVRRC